MESPDPRVSSEHEDDQSTTHPRRLSALYQYHNAPEVAPAHGLEYDDTIYPVSDKFPVVRESPFAHRYTGKHAYESDNRPPRIIFGMKVKTFLVVAAVVLLVVIGAAVGGAVGGKNLHQGVPSPEGTYGDISSPSSSPAPSPKPTTTSTTPTFSAPTPTYTPLSDCPQSNDTTYTSSFAKGASTSQKIGLIFTKYCAVSSPLSASGSSKISEAFVYSFSDCIETCASYNFLNSAKNCTVAAYQPTASRPSNCWVGSVSSLVSASSLKSQAGMDVALLTL